MNDDEEIVREYLKISGYKGIKHEPEGKRPPDFTINGEIAIEVRRLNENYFTNGEKIGYYEEGYSLRDFITNFLKKYKNEKLQKSYWVSLEFERPIPNLKDLEKKLKIKLDNYLNKAKAEKILEITPNVKFWIYTNEKDEDFEFKLVSTLDENGGGVVLQIYLSNINYCIQEKTEKIDKYKESYNEWWRLLVDNLFYGLSKESEIDLIKQSIILPKAWKMLKIIKADIKEAILTISN